MIREFNPEPKQRHPPEQEINHLNYLSIYLSIYLSFSLSIYLFVSLRLIRESHPEPKQRHPPEPEINHPNFVDEPPAPPRDKNQEV